MTKDVKGQGPALTLTQIIELLGLCVKVDCSLGEMSYGILVVGTTSILCQRLYLLFFPFHLTLLIPFGTIFSSSRIGV